MSSADTDSSALLQRDLAHILREENLLRVLPGLVPNMRVISPQKGSFNSLLGSGQGLREFTAC